MWGSDNSKQCVKIWTKNKHLCLSFNQPGTNTDAKMLKLTTDIVGNKITLILSSITQVASNTSLYYTDLKASHYKLTHFAWSSQPSYTITHTHKLTTHHTLAWSSRPSSIFSISQTFYYTGGFLPLLWFQGWLLQHCYRNRPNSTQLTLPYLLAKQTAVTVRSKSQFALFFTPSSLLVASCSGNLQVD